MSGTIADGHSARRTAILAGSIAALGAGIVLTASLVRAEARPKPGGIPYVTTFENPSNALEIVLAKGDGQAYAAVAQDPTLSHPERFRPGAAEAAYRAQRPLLPYLAWVVAAGSDDRVPVALAAAVIASTGFAAAAAGLLVARFGWSPALGPAVLLIPGVVAAVQGLGPEPLGLAFSICGILLVADRRHAGAALSLALAGLARETFLLVPLSLFVYLLVRRRLDRRTTIALLVPIVVWGAWSAFVWVRLDASPFRAASRIGRPFAGLLAEARRWDLVSADSALAVATIALVILVAMHRETSVYASITYAYTGLLVVLGTDAWTGWENFTRPLIPLHVFGILAISIRTKAQRDLPPRAAGRAAEASDDLPGVLGHSRDR